MKQQNNKTKAPVDLLQVAAGGEKNGVSHLQVHGNSLKSAKRIKGDGGPNCCQRELAWMSDAEVGQKANRHLKL